jgi:hypothetical protein
MVRGWVALGSLALIAACLWVLNREFPSVYLQKGTSTFVAWTAVYFILRIILASRIQRLSDPERRYFLRKSLSVAYIAVTSIVVLIIWVQNIQTIVVGFAL